MLDRSVTPSQPASRKKHRAFIDPWFAIDAVKQNCDLPVDSKIADLARWAEELGYLHFTCSRCFHGFYSDSTVICPYCGYDEDVDEPDYQDSD